MNDLTPAELAYERQQQLYALKGVAVDAFGEPLAEQTGSTGVVRQIPITEDLLREDAQRREAIEIRKEGITWRRPEPLPATTYRKPAKPARTPMRRTTAPTTQRTAVVTRSKGGTTDGDNPRHSAHLRRRRL